jgi:hypothetical protein
MSNILSFMTIDQIKNHKFKSNKKVKQPLKPIKTTNVNLDGTVITIESLKDYNWDSK